MFGGIQSSLLSFFFFFDKSHLFCGYYPLTDINHFPGQVPIIRCPRGNAAEMVAEKLDKKLRENIRDTRNSLFSSDHMQAGQIT